jgi:hypothetical protein
MIMMNMQIAMSRQGLCPVNSRRMRSASGPPRASEEELLPWLGRLLDDLHGYPYRRREAGAREGPREISDECSCVGGD